jgi:4-aminobutyrate aminotransferase-like enzyme
MSGPPYELPGPRSRDLLKRADDLLYPGLSHGLGPFVLRSKQGWTLEDVDGHVFTDLISGMAAVPLGAANERILDAAWAAHRRIGMEDTHFYAHEHMVALAEALVEIAPGNLSRVDIALNGTEAVEIALRFMRRATGRRVVIGFMGAYHGESLATTALGAELAEFSRGVRDIAPGFVHVPYPNPYRTPFTPRAGGTGDGTVDFIRDHLVHYAVDPRDVAGVLIEPVMGSGGCVAPPDVFWSALVQTCREFDWLLAVDEVKTGFGRTGRLFAVERWGVEPDLLCLGKAMGGGVMPIGAVLGTERAMGFDDVSTGSTWSWFPGSCAAALETIAILREEPILENVRAQEAVALEELGAIEGRHDAVGDVRAIGGFLAIEFVKDRITKERDAELQERAAWAAARRGVLCDSSTTSLNLQPSLVMPPEELRAALRIVGGAVDAAVRGEP